MRIAVVHDYLTQRGGAERVVLSILRAFPEAALYTSIFDPDRTFPEFASHRVFTSYLSSIPHFRAHPRMAAPLLHDAFRRLELDGYELVLCSSSGWAHCIDSVSPRLVYCYTPPRWLYEPNDYFARWPRLLREASSVVSKPLMRRDQRAALAANRYIAISKVTADRIRRAYGIEAAIIHPPITLRPGPESPIRHARIEPGFLLTVARPRGYKRTDVVVNAARRAGCRLVVVSPAQIDPVPHNVSVLRDLADAELRWLYSNCRAVIAASSEDFGLTPVEAAAFGKPTVALRSGGYLETVQEGITGVFFNTPDESSIIAALDHLERLDLPQEPIVEHARQFSETKFIEQLRTEITALALR